MPTARELGFVAPIGQHRASRATVHQYRRWLDLQRTRESWAIAQCAVVGVLLQLCVFAMGFACAEVVSRVHGIPRAELLHFAARLSAAVCGVVFLLAAVTKPEGRAELAHEVLRGGAGTGARQGNAAAGIAISVVMIFALYGGYALVEVMKRLWIRWRVCSVDQSEVARMLAMISGAPQGIRPEALLKSGMASKSLRGPLAALILDGWVQFVEGGTMLTARSPAMRSLLHRHPLADVFQPECAM